jgi:hypothetical protein
MIGDQFPCAALAGAALQFHLCDDVIGDVHPQNYTGYGGPSKKNLLGAQEIFGLTFNLVLVLSVWEPDALFGPCQRGLR